MNKVSQQLPSDLPLPLPSVAQFFKAKKNEQKEIINKSISDTKNKLYNTISSSYRTANTKYNTYSIKNAICSVDNRESGKKRNKWTKIIFVVLIVFLTLLIFSVGFYIRQNNTNIPYDPIYGIIFGGIGILGCIIGHYYNTKTYIDNSQYDDEDTDIESLKNKKKEIRTTLEKISSLQKEISSLQRKLNYGKIKDKSKQIIQDYKKKPTVLPIQYDEKVLLPDVNKKQLDVITEDDEGSDNVKSVKQNSQSNLLVTGENQSLNAITETITRKQKSLQSLNSYLLSLKETYEKLKKSNDAYNELQNYDIEIQNNIRYHINEITHQPSDNNFVIYINNVSGFLNNVINNFDKKKYTSLKDKCIQNESNFNKTERNNININIQFEADLSQFIKIKTDIDYLMRPNNTDIDENGMDYLITQYIDIFSKNKFNLIFNKTIQAIILNICLDYLINVYNLNKNKYDSVIKKVQDIINQLLK